MRRVATARSTSPDKRVCQKRGAPSVGVWCWCSASLTLLCQIRGITCDTRLARRDQTCKNYRFQPHAPATAVVLHIHVPQILGIISVREIAAVVRSTAFLACQGTGHDHVNP